MSLEITVRCDAYSCFQTLSVDELDEVDGELNLHDWVEDAYEQHYCPACWQQIQADKEEVQS